MPWFRCKDGECGHAWFHNSILDEAPECLECGEPAEIFEPDRDEVVESEQTAAASSKARIAFARELARKRLIHAGISAPPVPVRELAEADGLRVVLRRNLGSLQGRLVGTTIELVKDGHPVVQRFTIAHELGHLALSHKHGDGKWAETEADHYANELLVPEPMLKHAVTITTSAAALRKMFYVSRPVLEIACKHHHCSAQLTD